MIQFGIISDIKPGFARVNFQEDEITTDWWPIIKMGTQNSKFCYPLHIGEQVACLSDQHSDDGVILGAVYNEQDEPPDSANEHTYVAQFSDGTTLIYDLESHELKADVKGDATITANKLSVTAIEGVTITGNLTVIGNISAGGIAVTAAGGGDGKMTSDADIETSGDVIAGTISLASHVHLGVTSGNSTSGAPKP